MELTENEDLNEIFEECNNTEIQNQTSELISNDLSCDHNKFETINETNIKDGKNQKQELKESGKYDKNSDNHYVVPLGIIIVLMTIYLVITSIQKCLVGCVVEVANKEQQLHEQIRQKAEILNYLQTSEYSKNSVILERLLEYKDICKDLEIFTKNKYLQSNKDEENRKEMNKEDDKTNDVVLKEFIEVNSNRDVGEEDSGSDADASASGSGNCAKKSRNKHKKSKYSIKCNNSKNGFNKYNKSGKFKHYKNNKKELNLNKNSTAEPIIYLFALVFIYLLLKAASDINQHYKSQNKNDKRLRRCSLQSYAQIHRPDRRASKESVLKQKQQQRLKCLYRSSSQDQQNNHQQRGQVQQQHLMDTLSQKSEQQQRQQHIATTGSPIRYKLSYSSNWQLLKNHTTTQSLDNSDILTSSGSNPEIFLRLVNRRYSVPDGLNYQRRTSVTSPLIMDHNDSLVPETKRRVRMINRH